MCDCRYGAFNVQAGTQFCDSAFQAEIAKGTLSSTSLDKYCCVALAGSACVLHAGFRSIASMPDVHQLGDVSMQAGAA